MNVYLVSLGCDKNRVDGEVMIGHLRNAGYIVENTPEYAAAIIINTCGFIKDAVEESINLVLELAEYKKNGSCNALIVTGCMSARYHDEIKREIPEADAILGVGNPAELVAAVRNLIGEPPHGAVASGDSCQPCSPMGVLMPSNPSTAIEMDPYLVRLSARSDDAIPHIAYVKIAEGCDNHCAYCTIPSIRGGYISRKMENILEECRQLIALGARELVLVAQDTSLYGTDIYGEKRLPQLIREIAKLSGQSHSADSRSGTAVHDTNQQGQGQTQVPQIWIRLMYVYPEHITPELIDTIANTPQVCKYLDMPIQHSEDTVLERMGRTGTRSSLLKLIAELRRKIPDISLRTTLMVGFPGETAENFRQMYHFVKDVKFDRLGVFPYSREEGTPAAGFEKQVRPHVKQARLSRIMSAQQQIHFAKQKQYVGRTLPVIIDDVHKNHYTGRTQYDAYEVDANVNFTMQWADGHDAGKQSALPQLSVGQIVHVTMTHTNQYDLRGQCEYPFNEFSHQPVSADADRPHESMHVPGDEGGLD